MTRDEFVNIANKEIDQMLATKKNRMMGLVERAWAEGKKNAEVSGIPDIHFEDLLQWSLNTDIPSACQNCSNHPSNGGSGICHCIMGIPQIKG